MEYVIVFKFGPIHTPYPRGKWDKPFAMQVTDTDKRITVDISIETPKRIGIHDIDSVAMSKEKVADAYIPIRVVYDGAQLTETEFKAIVNVTFSYVTFFVERLRINAHQAHLKLARVADLEFEKVCDIQGEDLPDLTKAFGDWFETKHGGRPLPYVSKDDWCATCKDRPPNNDDLSQWRKLTLHESLLLDADIYRETDVRIAVMYSALACVRISLKSAACSD